MSVLTGKTFTVDVSYSNVPGWLYGIAQNATNLDTIREQEDDPDFTGDYNNDPFQTDVNYIFTYRHPQLHSDVGTIPIKFAADGSAVDIAAEVGDINLGAATSTALATLIGAATPAVKDAALAALIQSGSADTLALICETLPCTAATLVSITITGADTVSLSAQAQYKAIGTYSNNTTKDITTLGTWSLTTASNATDTINSTGLVSVPETSPATTHNATISCTYGGKTGTLTVTITNTPPAKLLEFYVARNPDTGSLSTYANGAGVLKTILTATGSTAAYPASVKTMTTDAGGYQRPDLFSGSKPYASLYPSVPNGTYIITLLAEDGQQISYNITVTDSGPVQVLRQITTVAYTVGSVYYLRAIALTRIRPILVGPDSYGEGSGAQYALKWLMSDNSTLDYTDPYNMDIVSPPSGTSISSSHYASTAANTISADTPIQIRATTGASINYDQTFQSENGTGSGNTYPNDTGGLKKDGTITYAISGFPGAATATITLRYSSNQNVPTPSILVNGVAVTLPDGVYMLAKDGGYDTISFPVNLTGNNDTIQISPATNYFSQDYIRIVASVNNFTVLDTKNVTIINVTSPTQNLQPSITLPLIDRTITEGQAFSFDLQPDTHFSDPNGDALTYHMGYYPALVYEDDLPSWASYSAGVFSGTPPVTGADRDVTFRLVAYDGQLSNNIDFVVHIAKAGCTPTSNAIDAQVTSVGSGQFNVDFWFRTLSGSPWKVSLNGGSFVDMAGLSGGPDSNCYQFGTGISPIASGQTVTVSISPDGTTGIITRSVTATAATSRTNLYTS